ncbi:MAG: hypothetical protein ACTSO2_19140 [Promethearchaeota archaeon]
MSITNFQPIPFTDFSGPSIPFGLSVLVYRISVLINALMKFMGDLKISISFWDFAGSIL